MDNGDDTDDLAIDLIDQPVFVDEKLPTVLTSDLRHNPPAPRQDLQAAPRSENLSDHRRGIARRILRDVGGNAMQVVPNLRRPNYFKIHLARSCYMTACGMPPSETRRCWPSFIFSSTKRWCWMSSSVASSGSFFIISTASDLSALMNGNLARPSLKSRALSTL